LSFIFNIYFIPNYFRKGYVDKLGRELLKYIDVDKLGSELLKAITVKDNSKHEKECPNRSTFRIRR
jgi:hypothetical protein